MPIKKVINIFKSPEPLWVGDGFPVKRLISYQTPGVNISPFLLLDYAGPSQFKPSSFQRGVELHPHRGFETVTIVYQGEIEHKDNAGHSGKIGPGDVQWMTAARGILHEEMHSLDFSKKGGTLEVIQLWVNLPAEVKMSAPHYQELLNKQIPQVSLDNQGSMLRVIAGDFHGASGAAKTFTPLNLWDIRLKSGYEVDKLYLPDSSNTLILVLKGTILINKIAPIHEKELVCFESEGDHISIECTSDAIMLLLNGDPIKEPIVGKGPFVMNTKEQIEQAFTDYRNGRFQ